jgi:DNA-binding CsgD family transcriptional regulator
VHTVLSAADLLGRQAELAGLTELLGGPGGTALVVLGEAGSGKTALLEAAVALGADHGIRVLRVTGYEAESWYPYAGLHQLLMPVLDGLGETDDTAEHFLGGVFGLGDLALEPPGAATPPGEPDSRPAGDSAADVAEACLLLLRRVNSQRRTMIVIDDLQWLDAESARAVSALCRRLRTGDVDLVIAIRGQAAPEELGVRTCEYALAPLGETEARELLGRAAKMLHGHARHTVLRQAAGNPLALVEFGRAVEANTPGRLGIFDDGPLPVPQRLEALYRARARDLPPPTRRALLLAAAAGTGELTDALTTRKITIAAEDWLPAAHAGLITLDANSSGVVVPAFIHPLMRSAVFQSASYPEQADAHRNLATALTAYPERRAWHLAQSVWHPDEGIAALLEAVGREANLRDGYHAAAAAFERAAELSPEPRDACRRLTLAAESASSAEQRAWSLQLAERAAALGTEAGLADEELAEVQRLVGIGKFYVGADANLLRDLLTTLRSPAAEAGYLTAATAALAATAAYYAPVPAQLAELRAIIGRLPDPLTHPEAWDQPTSAVALLIYARAALSPFAPSSDPLACHGILDPDRVEFDLGSSRSMFGAGAYLLDQPELAAQVLELICQRELAARAVVNATLSATIASNNEMWGRWDLAVRQAEEAIELAIRFGERFNLSFAHITAGFLAVRQGRTEKARRHARAAEQAGVGISHSVPARTRHLRGLISLTEGDHQTAYTLLRGTLLTDERVPAHFHLSHYAVADFTLAAQHTGQQDDAATVLDGIIAHANSMTPGGARLSRRLQLLHDLARALIAAPQDATPLFEQALSTGAERWPFDQACARLHYGEHLRRTRRITEARPLLTAALDTFRSLGAAPWAKRAETEVRAAGVATDSDRAPDAGRQIPHALAALTPQQRAVAELAAKGLTNPQIGARLSISPKTVSVHLSRVFEQLGITSRAHLRDLAPPPRSG